MLNELWLRPGLPVALGVFVRAQHSAEAAVERSKLRPTVALRFWMADYSHRQAAERSSGIAAGGYRDAPSPFLWVNRLTISSTMTPNKITVPIMANSSVPEIRINTIKL